MSSCLQWLIRSVCDCWTWQRFISIALHANTDLMNIFTMMFDCFTFRICYCYIGFAYFLCISGCVTLTHDMDNLCVNSELQSAHLIGVTVQTYRWKDAMPCLLCSYGGKVLKQRNETPGRISAERCVAK